ncbi:MAG: 23S rRNA (adenine(2503)-C(2))-methyltransferase RlmN [Candidatus Pacebacteria bacterium]|nr:23S rRNA (adenine(2503)-C(2))-methyltransferase RlmN [Candidatus Paceibacterota bacterium]
MKNLEEILTGEPKFRLKQIKKAVFVDLIDDWEKVTTLPKELRQKLAENYPILELKEEKILASKNNQTTKALFVLNDGLQIETVLMKHEVDLTNSPQAGRRTVCVSSQAGCAMNCQFCATGQQGFNRNLSAEEIIDQVLFFARFLKKSNEKVTNVVFMGMGEPFLNYDNVLAATKILNDKDGFNLGARHISISTCGIIEGIERLANEKMQINLAISLHAPNNEIRSRLMPINEKYPIEKILASVDDYIKKTGRRVMFEYLMIDGVNDSEAQAEELAKLLIYNLHFGNQKNFSREDRGFYFVNLISFNPIGHSEFKPSPGWKIKKFKEILEKMGVVVTQRYRFGKEIKAACGQLAGKENEI